MKKQTEDHLATDPPPYCPCCGSPAGKAFAQIKGPYGMCAVCFELVQLVPLPDQSVAPFLERASPLTTPADVIAARTQLEMRLRSG